MIRQLATLNVDLGPAIMSTIIIRLNTLWFLVILGFASFPVAMQIARNNVFP